MTNKTRALKPVPRPWYVVLDDRVDGHFLPASIGLAGVIFAAGAVVAGLAGFLSVYLKTDVIWIGTFGIAWTSAWICWAGKHLSDGLRQAGAVFVPPYKFNDAVTRWTRWMFSNGLMFSAAIVAAAGASLAVISSSRHGTLEWFPPEWSQDPNLWAKNLVVALFAVPVWLLIMTGAVGIVSYALLVWDFHRQDVVDLPNVVRARLRYVAQFGIRIGLAWSVGVSLVVIALRPNLNSVTLAQMAILSILGLVVVFWPQFMLHDTLQRTKNAEIERLTSLALASAGPDAVSHDEALARLAQQDTWIYEPREMLVMLADGALPVATLVLGAPF